MSGVVGRPSRKFGRPSWRSANGRDTLPDVPEGWEALLDVRQLSGGPPRCAEGPPNCSGVVRWPFRMSVSGQETLLNVWKASQMSSSVRKALSDVLESSGGSLESPGEVGRPTRISRSVRETLPNDRGWREALSTTPGHPGGPSDHSQTSVKVSRLLPDNREGLPTTPGHPRGPPGHLGGFPDHSRTSGRVS